ncbi:hypothetical protein [Sulfurimonas sp.]|uniref:hypothetical protein n=1 Tax=Sulfurimonas sp. TaxID=2022749 RepID=UPI0025E25491|nr:hypothetical protein [Sulfurimonas sp.]MDD5157689.1 hypothetical protein [Sulfurimonas sp.]
MKKSIFICYLLASSVFALTLFAQEEYFADKSKISLKTTDALEIGVQSYWYEYEEKVNGAFFMSNKGSKYGASLTGTKSLGSDYFIIGDVRYATGNVEYKSASGTGDVSDNMYEVRLAAGKEVVVDGYLLSTFAGLGYRRLDNDLRDLGSGGYRRTSQYLYLPIGVTHRFMIDNSSRISTTIEYDYLLKAEQKSYLSDISPADAALFGDPVNKQKSGYGIRASTAYEEKYWSAGLFFNYWKIDDSEINYYGVWSVMEPRNETKEIGVQLKYRFN